MSYIPGLSEESIFVTAWNSTNQTMPNRPSSTSYDMNYDFTFNLDTIGVGDRFSITSDVISTPDNLYAYWCGDVRSRTSNVSTTDNNYCIEFDNSTMTVNAPNQSQSNSWLDDMCHAVYNSAELKIKKIYRADGNSIAPYVRVIGFLIGD